MTRQRHHAAIAGALALLAGAACSDSSPLAEEGYILNPNPGSIEPFCKWDEDPSPPDGSVAHRIGVSVPIGSRSTCEEFDPEDVDDLLVEEYQDSVVEGCDPEPFELLRGCFDANGERCAFSAYIFSRCPLSNSE